ncbi:two component transcriptional regulator, LytTR family [Singulisphaera sp. GP187]|uniref:LytR/AlgR family response regulator transcription factor n=1 Tax=Singulisphaera sp. GP187 TaxID=1882752 RepID=UPI0009297046|nr:response regulator transcription factor [Singulisphaera sp. GP187]SIO46294.1 two component transcriptional regulator, LytTR family [Singulisphaera sp. GP187]
MIRAVVVEDEPLARQYLKSLLEGTGRVQVVGEAGDGGSGLQLCRECTPDVAFLDIEMAGPDGLTVAGRLLALPCPPLVVFVTGYAGHAVDAFRVEAVDYLLKPIDPDLILESVRRLEHRLTARGTPAAGLADREAGVDRIQVRDPADGVLHLLSRHEVVAVLRRKRRTWIHTASTAYPSHEPLSRLGRRLGGPPFLQVSRDAIVNLEAIDQVRRLGDRHYEVVLRDQPRTRVETSRTGAGLLAEKLRPS